MNHITRVIILLLVTTTACGTVTPQQTKKSDGAVELEQTKKDRLKRQPQQLCDAALAADYNTVADLTYPKLIEVMGGPERYLSAIAKAMKETQSDQFRVIAVEVGEPRDAVEVGGENYAIVPTTMKMKVPEGTLVGEAFMIAASRDGGQNWTFVDSGGRNLDQRMLKTLFPLAAEKLRIPEVKRPVLHRGPV